VDINLDSGGSRNNFDKFFRDDGLSGSVVRDLELVNHLARVLGSVIHGGHPGALFAAGVFLHGEVDDGGELEFGAGLKDVGVDGIVNVDALGRGEVSVAEKRLLGQAVRHHGLKLVIKQDSLIELESALEDHVGDGGSVVERGRLPSVLLDLALDVIRHRLLDDGSAFVADEEHLRLNVGRCVGHERLDGFVDARVNTAAKTSVGRDGDDELLGDVFGSFGAGLIIDVDASAPVSARRLQATLSLSVLGGAHHLHGSGDLFDVTRTLQTHLDFFEGGHTSDGADSRWSCHWDLTHAHERACQSHGGVLCVGWKPKRGGKLSLLSFLINIF